jgi:flagellar hook-associated protein 3 FlgL
MIDRVGTLSHSQYLLSEFERIQSRNVRTEGQIASGKVGAQYQDVNDKAGVLAAAKMSAARADALMEAAKQVEQRLSLQDSQLVQLGGLADDLREAFNNAAATGHGEGLMESIKSIYETAVSLLNTKVDGVHIYGGTRSDVAPVNALTLDDLLAAPAVADVFENSPLPQSRTIGENLTIETGQLASDLATDLFQTIRDAATFDAGVNGPFASHLTQAQTQFIGAQLAAAPAIAQGINLAAATNGIRYNQVEGAVERQEDMKIYLAKFIGDIEDVDIAAAITRLNQDQAAAQAAARMIAQLNNMTLLNVLPLR